MHCESRIDTTCEWWGKDACECGGEEEKDYNHEDV